MQALPGSVDARQRGRQAAYDAEGHFFAENAAGTQLPAAFLRLRAYFRSECVRDLCSGVTSSPKGPSRTESRREPAFWRHFLAGGRVFAAAAYETFPSASFLRRRALLVRNPVRSPGSGVTFSPRGAFLQRMRTRPSLRRHYFRRRETFRRECRWNSPSGAVFSPEGALSRLRALALLACACGEEKVLRTHDQPRRKDLCDDARRQHVRRGHAGGAAENCRV